MSVSAADCSSFKKFDLTTNIGATKAALELISYAARSGGNPNPLSTLQEAAEGDLIKNLRDKIMHSANGSA